MLDDRDRYWPGRFDEMAADPIPTTLLNEPARDVIELRPGQSAASLHALLVGLRSAALALLGRMENRGVQVARDDQRQVATAQSAGRMLGAGRIGMIWFHASWRSGHFLFFGVA